MDDVQRPAQDKKTITLADLDPEGRREVRRRPVRPVRDRVGAVLQEFAECGIRVATQTPDPTRSIRRPNGPTSCNRDTNTATCRVTLTGPTITAASRTAQNAAVISLDAARQRRQQRILVVPPARLVQHLHETAPAVNCWSPPLLTSLGVAVVRAVVRGERRDDHHRVDAVAGRWALLRHVRR